MLQKFGGVWIWKPGELDFSPDQCLDASRTSDWRPPPSCEVTTMAIPAIPYMLILRKQTDLTNACGWGWVQETWYRRQQHARDAWVSPIATCLDGRIVEPVGAKTRGVFRLGPDWHSNDSSLPRLEFCDVVLRTLPWGCWGSPGIPGEPLSYWCELNPQMKVCSWWAVQQRLILTSNSRLEVFYQLQMLLESAIGCDLHERIFDSSFYPFFLSCMTHPYAAADDDALWIFLFPRIQKEFAPKGPEAFLLPFSRHVVLNLRHVGKQNLDTWWHLQSWTMRGFLNRVNAKVDNFDRSQNMFSRCSGKTLTKMAVALCSLAKLREVVENCCRNQLTRCAIHWLKCLIILR